MKILHFSTQRGFRGGERQLIRIHEGILAAGEESVLLCDCENRELLKTENTVPVKMSGLNAILLLLKMKSIIRDIKPDVIHCHDSRSLSIISLLRNSPVPTVFSRKTVYPIKTTRASRLKYSSLSALVAVSRASAEAVYSLMPELAVTVIPDGVSVESGDDRSAVRNRFGIADDQFLFASVGYFTGEKNLPLLLKCADILNREFPKSKLLLVGSVVESVRETVQNHPAIIAPGAVENAEKLYAGFDCYLSSSTEEGLGSALLDAVVRDIPALALDSGGSRDIFPGNDRDHCFTEDEFLMRFREIAAGENVREFVAARGEEARKRFSIEQLRKKHLELYRTLCGK